LSQQKEALPVSLAELGLSYLPGAEQNDVNINFAKLKQNQENISNHDKRTYAIDNGQISNKNNVQDKRNFVPRINSFFDQTVSL